MADPQSPPPPKPAGDVDARIAALEQYLTTAHTPSPGAPSTVFAGGTVVHVPPFGSFHLPADFAPRPTYFLAAGLLFLALLWLCTRAGRHPPSR